MMKAVQAYYDGKTFVPMQNYSFRPQQKVLIVVDEDENDETAAKKFLQLAWQGDETADDILSGIKDRRVQSRRFGAENALFD